MRARPKLDRNHNEIVQALRQMGCSVQSLAAVGGGVPDLLVGICSVNVLIEVKDGEAAPSARKLTPAQHEWIKGWRGAVGIVTSVAEAVVLVDRIRGWR